MPEYVIQTREMIRIVTLLHRVLKAGFTFFDGQDNEITELNVPGRSPWCEGRRRDPDFDARCRLCDRTHLEEARRSGQPLLYHCHAGLLEEIVPLYDKHGVYLGAIAVGQMREAAAADGDDGLRRVTADELRDLGDLLKYLSEYICDNELVKRAARSWPDRLIEYVDQHPGEKITLPLLARVTGKSVSFLSHNIPRHLGTPLKAYLRRRKMALAQKLLAEGHRVGECADRLGYRDSFYFSREFKHFYGYPPKDVCRLVNFSTLKGEIGIEMQNS